MRRAAPTVGRVTSAAVAGLLTGLSLIIAIGAQNAFVLRQGLARQHVGVVVAICALSDVVLIFAGVAGIGTIVEQAPWVLDGGPLARRRLPDLVRRERRCCAPAAPTRSQAAAHGAGTPASAVATALALTWLNPHVYLDTVLLLGSIANQHGAVGRWWFAAGAAVGSVLWFAGLGYGARRACTGCSPARAPGRCSTC